MKKILDKELIEELTGYEWSVRTVDEFVFLNLETKSNDPTIPALFEAFSNLSGAEFWKEKDQQYVLATEHHLVVRENDNSFVTMIGWLKPLKDSYRDNEKFLNLARENKLPRFDNLEIKVVCGGPRSLLADYYGFLQDAFAKAASDVRLGNKDLNIFTASYKADDLPNFSL